ncbi:FixH family protein [Polaribacter uvawellassae]|uniref:FixH family protein n=1 Tax=Polaribacter uvawellassae TaxID=3133495 RepID=UPI00321A2DC1
MKIKLNWGFGVVIAFIGFISFIMYFIITMSSDNKYSYDLVATDYYNQELKFQDNIDATQNAKNLKENIKIERVKEGMKIIFPKEFKVQDIKGKVFLYRPSNKQLDYEMPIALSDSSYLLMPDKRLLDGRWNIIVKWTYNQQSYLFKKEIFY